MKTNIYFSTDIHLSHRNICAFSPSRLDVLGLNNYDKAEVKQMVDIRRDRDATPEAKKVAKMFIEKLVKEYDEALIERWNSIIGFSDDVYLLGDVSFARTKEETAKFLDRMHGKIYLLRGNHDHATDTLDRFEWVKDYHEERINGQHIVMSHYQFIEFNHQQRAGWAIHGHQHSMGPKHPGKVLDCSMEQTGKVAIDFSELKAYMDTRPVCPHGSLGIEE